VLHSQRNSTSLSFGDYPHIKKKAINNALAEKLLQKSSEGNIGIVRARLRVGLGTELMSH
jgi:hypothetical protein